MIENTMTLSSTDLLGWLVYGIALIGCVLGSLRCSTMARPKAALAFGTLVWTGACLPFAMIGRSNSDGAILVYGTASIFAVGFLFVASTLADARTDVAAKSH